MVEAVARDRQPKYGGKSGRGGARRGGGRPFGTVELVERRKKATESYEEYNKRLIRQLGEAHKRIQLLEDQLGYNTIFEGDSKALLTAVMTGRYSASPQQIYSARALLDREYPPATTIDGRPIEAIKRELAEEWAGDREEAARKHAEWLDACARMTAFELGRRLQGRAKHKTMTGAPAMIVEAVDKFLTEKQFDGHPIAELMPPVEPRQPIKKRPPPPMIDSDEYGVGNGTDDAEPVEAAEPADTRRSPPPPSSTERNATNPQPAQRSSIATRVTEHGNIIYVQEVD
jgi:hypothetical protein